VRSIFLQGVAHLGVDALPPFLAALAEPIRRIEKYARELGVPSRSLYLGFARELLPGAHPVVGCERETQLVELLEDWTNDAVDAAVLAPLVDALPIQAAEVVDPSKWPSTTPQAVSTGRLESLKTDPELNRTLRPSVAKLPS
jgi:hypothetical protein